MREVKFRAWDEKNKKWINITTVHMLLHAEDRVFDNITNKPIFCELVEFTGIRYSNGDEIFEGDIIDNLVVTYCGNQQSGLGMNVGWYLQRDNFESWVELKSENNHKKMGNIYENPELLEK